MAVKRAKPNLGGPTIGGLKIQDQVALKPTGEPNDQNQVTLKSKGKQDKKKAAVAAEEVTTSKPLNTIDQSDQPSSSGGLANPRSKQSKKRITRDSSPSSILSISKPGHGPRGMAKSRGSSSYKRITKDSRGNPKFEILRGRTKQKPQDYWMTRLWMNKLELVFGVVSGPRKIKGLRDLAVQ